MALDQETISESISADVMPLAGIGTEPPFFPVSATKFVVLSFVTLGLYELYWFDRNWRRIKARERTNISPAIRTIFAYFYCYQCVGRVRDYDVPGLGDTKLAAGPLAIGWIVTSLLWKLPDPYWWITLFSFVFLIPVQVRINRINTTVSPNHDRNNRFSAWNWAAIVIGGILVALAVMGTLIPDEEDNASENTVLEGVENEVGEAKIACDKEVGLCS